MSMRGPKNGLRLMSPQRESHVQSCGREGLAGMGTEADDSMTTGGLGRSWKVCETETGDWHWPK